MTRATVVYEDFQGGEWGTLGARRARPGMFSGSNVRVFRDGSIGPRPGLKSLGVTGLPAGTPWGVTYRPLANALLFVIGTAVRVSAFSAGAASSSAGTLGATPTRIIRFNESTRRLNSKTYFTNYGDKLYSVDNTTLATVSTTPNGNNVELYRDRLIASLTDARSFFSDANDFATWDALNYIYVGYEYPTTMIVAHRDGLSLFSLTNIWRITGTLGSTDVLRMASNALALNSQGDLVVDSDTCIFLPSARTAPVTWDGGIANERALAHLETWDSVDSATFYGGGIARRNNDVLFVSDASAHPGLLRSNNVWTVHAFGITTSGAMTRVSSDKFLLLSKDATPVPYMLDMSIDRPAFTSDTYARPGDNTDTPLTASFSLPEYWDEQGREIRVRSVIVNARKWQTGASPDNNLTVTVTALDRFGPSAARASASQSWTEAGASASTGGDNFRQVLNFGDQGSGGGFQLAFSALKGVAIRDVAVVLDVAETRAA